MLPVTIKLFNVMKATIPGERGTGGNAGEPGENGMPRAAGRVTRVTTWLGPGFMRVVEV